MPSGNVGCRLPHGLVIAVVTQDAEGREVARKELRLNGPKNGEPVGVTPNVDQDFWEAFCKQDPKFVPLEKGLIFFQSTPGELTRQGKDAAQVPTGLEQIQTSGDNVVDDPRMPNDLRGKVAKLDKAN